MSDTALRARRVLVVGPAPSAGPAHQAARLLAGRLGQRTGCAVELHAASSSEQRGADADVALPLPAGSAQGWDVVFLVATPATPVRDADGSVAGNVDASTRAIAALYQQ